MPEEAPKSRFVHLHVHSHYSLLEALPKVKKLIAHVQKLGHDAVAITDNGNLYGAIEFYQKAAEAGVKPIIGMDAYLAKEGRHLKRARIDTRPNRLVLLAENNEGYKNLVLLSSIGFLEGFYYKPRIDKEVLRTHAKGLIALSGGHQGEIEEALKEHNQEKAVALIKEYVDIFGEGNFFLELVDRPEIPEQEATNAQMIQLGKELGVPVVATKNTYYLKPGDVEAWKILNCIKGQKTLEDFERLQQYDYDASMVTGEYMEERFADCPEAIENTRRIADRCNVTLELGSWNFADYKIPEGKTFDQVLRERAYAELPGKGVAVDADVSTRIDYELSVIAQKKFAPYFLIVSDYIEWARKNGIVTTTRGSAAGSLVSFAIGISTVNPLTYKLPFERFLNPERPSAPDVDGDFADNRRDEVIEYVRQKYGADKVAQICTFGTMLARGSVRDVGRALGETYAFVDQIAKLVPEGSQGFPMTLERALGESADLKKSYDTNAGVRRVVDLARQIEGCARHVSIHAAGAVISPTALTDFTPLQIDTREGKVITQYEMKSVESAGLLKMDFLGIRNLSILGDAIKLVKKTKDVDIVLEQIPVNDAKTFELLAEGKTMGTFQLNGDGVTKYLMDLKPKRIEDIMAMVALYRPGPIESIPEYIRRKHDPSLVKFLDPRMEEILDQSYGVIVYQDDVMLIAIKLAGYSWLEADKLRKAMGKKIPEEMAAQKEKLLAGFVKNGLTPAKANDLWKLIEPFAAYGFNKAHAASYGMIAYDTAYMKANYPAEYMTALMTAECADLETIAEAVKECSRMGIEVLPPDLNESLSNFTYVNDSTIRFGLVAIKNLGEEVIASIIEERTRLRQGFGGQEGPFKDLSDFAKRVTHRAFNKKSLEALIKSGAMDRFGERAQLLENVDRILMLNKTAQREREANQATLFAAAPSVMNESITLKPSAPATMRMRLAWEKELLGLYVSEHPFAEAAKSLAEHLTACGDVAGLKDGAFVKCGGLVASVKEIVTKKGEAMAFVSLEDLHGKTEVIVFPSTYAQCKEHIVPDSLVLVSAKVGKRDDEEAKLLANSFVVVREGEAQELATMLASGMWVPENAKAGQATEANEASRPERLRACEPPGQTKPAMLHRGSLSIALRGKPDQEMIAQLREIISSCPGTERVCFLVEAGGGVRRIETDYCVTISDGLVSELASLVGRQNIVLQ
ncbi:DNA polymerase III subunit alpha [Candidatus Uhrbacteria bacterium RIFCSPHIGHO2_01_FULL_63_20]|uniref:DNA polymerase III subunit alpha n=1 Tax=Candidatus Uhrbacteria bacterium RIFCSPHIGHO2_01_FULL_63_20 TaxID=1802385 RepID=A0A1F7TL36_9BACT|nr:MAG: DNA polymerase III subunit alpha [Candidatus Uhrbacteria bacterium RIFCSPHIGHO2_01_FULL_63_20]